MYPPLSTHGGCPATGPGRPGGLALQRHGAACTTAHAVVGCGCRRPVLVPSACDPRRRWLRHRRCRCCVLEGSCGVGVIVGTHTGSHVRSTFRLRTMYLSKPLHCASRQQQY